MKDESTRQLWFTLCRNFTADDHKINTAFEDILQAYKEPHRAYHTLAHIDDMLGFITSLEKKIANSPMLLFAAFFHDAVYIPGSDKNESESAKIAVETMRDLNVPATIIHDTEKLILLTKSHASTGQSVSEDMLLFLDTDLAILGAEPEKYKTYAENVRKEFKMYPDNIYNNGRKLFLHSMLALPMIFKTAEFRKYEAQARVNISNELMSKVI